MDNEIEFLSIIIPVYNEEKGIGETLGAINTVLSDRGISYEIIVVNDGSTDGTDDVLKKFNEIILISRKRNRGYGFSLKEGIKKARGEWILICDADGSYPIEEMPFLINESSGYDMTIGERSGKKVHLGVFNRIGKLLLRTLIFALTSNWIKDINSGFRIFNKDLAFSYWGLFPDGFSFTTTLTVAALIEQCKVKTVSINYSKRLGKSKIRPFRDFTNFTILILKIVSFFKPMRFYLPVSIFFLIASILRAMRDITVVSSIGSVAVMFFMISMQAFFFGLLADLIVNKHKKMH